MNQKLRLSSLCQEIMDSAFKLCTRTTLEYEEQCNRLKFIKECQKHLIESFNLPYYYMEEYIRLLLNAPKELIYDGIHIPHYRYTIIDKKGE